MSPTANGSQGDGPGPPRLEHFPSLETFGERLVVARPRRLRRRLGAGGLSVLVAFVGTTGVALTAATGSPVPPFLRSADDAAIVRPDTASLRISTARARDPRGGAPWTIRVGTAGDGTRCVSVGQVVGGRLGTVGRDGRFVPADAASDAQCGQTDGGGAGVARPTVVGLRDVARLTGGRTSGTVLFGAADPGTDEVRALLPNGRRVDAALADDGSFVAILPGEPRQAQPIVEVREGSAGGQVSFQLPRTLPDPAAAGGPYTLIAEQQGQRVVNGRPVGDPSPTCFRLAPTVSHPRAGTRGPAVCGVPAGAWAAVTPLRRGARGSFVVGRQARAIEWAGLPTRTLVVVRAPGERSLVRLRFGGRDWAVRRAGVEFVDRNRSDGIYFGILPGVVTARSVGVRVQPVRAGAQGPAPSPEDVPVRQIELQQTGGTAP